MATKGRRSNQGGAKSRSAGGRTSSRDQRNERGGKLRGRPERPAKSGKPAAPGRTGKPGARTEKPARSPYTHPGYRSQRPAAPRPRAAPVAAESHAQRRPAGPGTESLLYGLRSVTTQVRADPQRIVRILVEEDRTREQSVADLVRQAEELGIRVQRASRDELGLLSRGAVHQGVLAEVTPFKFSDVNEVVQVEEPALLLVLDEVTDPQNLGAAARAAWALGGTGMILPKDRSAPINAIAEKVASGALAHLPVAHATNLARTLGDLKKRGVWVIGLDVEGTTPLYEQDLTGPVALVIGSEGSGMRRLTKELCDVLVTIPMAHPDAALNAADAAAVALYEAARQRAVREEEEEE